MESAKNTGGRKSNKNFGSDPMSIQELLTYVPNLDPKTGEPLTEKDRVALMYMSPTKRFKFYENQKLLARDHNAMEAWAADGFQAGLNSETER